ncbi:hypothetical protein JCM6882_001795 [Rhodosporidiobolus microsporus]
MSAPAITPARPPSILRTASRTSSIRRKPVPVDEMELDDASSARTRSVYGGAAAGSEVDERLHGREGSASTSARPTGASDPLRRTASSSSRDPYSSTSPSAMTPGGATHASLSRNPSTSSHRPGDALYPAAGPSALSTEEVLPLSSSHLPPSGGLNGSNGHAYPALAPARSSLHSQRSSVAPESVFGTAPVGVIGKTKPREVIRIERDYSAGETCQFWSGWIWELEGRISPTDFQNTLNELNTVLASAHDPYKSCFDNCVSVLTLYLSPLVLTSHYEREMRKFHRILERANRELFNPVGLNLLSPRRNAYLFLEVEYY